MSQVVEQGTSSPHVERYVAAFEALKDRRPAGPAALEQARQAAIARFAALGFPTTADEEYRFTNVAPIATTPFDRAPEHTAVAGADLTGHLYGSATAAELVFVNGRFQLALSSVAAVPAGLTVSGLAEALDAPEVLRVAHAARLERDVGLHGAEHRVFRGRRRRPHCAKAPSSKRPSTSCSSRPAAARRR